MKGTDDALLSYGHLKFSNTCEWALRSVVGRWSSVVNIHTSYTDLIYSFFATLYPGHTEAATVGLLRPIFDQIALDRSKVSMRSQCGRSVVAVRGTSRRMVAVAILVAVRNFGMFKIPHCDFSIAVQSVCCLSALAQLVLWS